MLIKTLFNLETNSPANLPNEYFLMLEKQQKYNDLHQKLEKLNLHNRNLIQSISTIKITLLQLIDDFIKPQEPSFITKIQQTLISTFQNLDKVCLNLQKTIETKISNYQSHIQSLNKQYKEKLEQVTHYRKKVESIRKGLVDTREDKQKLNRNIDKKRMIQKQCQKAESLLIQNYQNFYQQSHEYLKIVPHQILLHLIQGNLQTASKIIETVNSQVPIHRKRLRRQSIMSSAISQISDADALSEYSEEDFSNSNEIKIIIEPESDQVLNEDIQIIQMVKNQETTDDQNTSKLKSPKLWKSNNKNLKISLLRRSSIEDQLKNKIHLIQNIKKLLEIETGISQNKLQTNFSLEKAFQNIQAPLSHGQKIKQIFESKKNKFCDPPSKIHRRKQNNGQKTNSKAFHEKSFVLQKEQFKEKHSLRSRKKLEKRDKERLRNEETLNCPSDEQNVSQMSQSRQDNNISISSELSGNNSKSIHQKSAESSIVKGVSSGHINSLIKHEKQVVFKTEENSIGGIKQEKKKLEPTTESKHHLTQNHLSNHSFGSIQQLNFPSNRIKQSNFAQVNKKKVIEHLFYVPNQKINSKKPFDKNPFQTKPSNCKTHTQKKPQTDAKHWFSTVFCSHKPKDQNSVKISQIEINNLKINEHKSYPYTTQNLQTVPKSTKIDFSIFQKMV